MLRLTARAVACCLASLCFLAVSTADDSKLKVKVGDAFPDFKLSTTKAYGSTKEPEPVSLASLKGKNVVIAFYPKAKTGG